MNHHGPAAAAAARGVAVIGAVAPESELPPGPPLPGCCQRLRPSRDHKGQAAAHAARPGGRVSVARAAAAQKEPPSGCW